MPTYPLTFPAIHPDKVVPTRRRVQSAAESPFTLQRQIYDWGASAWKISITMQPMGREDAQVFGEFLDQLNGMVGTFTFDLDPWCPGLTNAPGVRTFRLSDPNVTWDSDKAAKWGFQLEAVENL